MTSRDDDSKRLTSQRPTARDVPIAKFSDLPIGTSPPRGLRGPSLLPGQGAPEAIIPEEIELAVLREADTLDGPRVQRAAARPTRERASSPPPTPVQVEVPRARKPAPIDLEALTPKTPSARSVQSGTLMSIGSVDPRAPTELSLPSPRRPPVSERPYPVPEAVVDHTPLSPERREPIRLAGASTAQPQPHPEWSPYARPPLSSGRRAPSVPGYGGADSPAPAARNFAREPESYPPGSDAHGRAPQSSSRPSARYSEQELPPAYHVHADLEALPRDYDYPDDNFDLRGISTQREPLAGRRSQSTPELSVEPEAEAEPVVEQTSVSRRGRVRASGPSSSSAITLWVDRARARASSADILGASESAPHSAPPSRARATVPLSWVVGAALVGLTVAVLLIVAMRGNQASEPPHLGEARAAARAPVALAPVAVPEAQLPVPQPGVAAAQPLASTRPVAAPVPSSAASVSKPAVPASSARVNETSAPAPRSSSNAAHGSVGSEPADLGPKSQKSIY